MVSWYSNSSFKRLGKLESHGSRSERKKTVGLDRNSKFGRGMGTRPQLYDGIFYLCYTVVRQHEAATKDTPNFLITSPSIDGPWSDPVFINSSGFDPSLFHDDDGKKYWLNMVWDHRPNRHPFYGIALQEYSISNQSLVGNREIIFKGSKLGLTEGPHLYKRNGYYYLLTAEGGTEF